MSAARVPSPSARCPFCRKSVSEDLLRFGGNCPHCLIEIPGEEAPTDPGAELRAAQKVVERKERKRRRRRRVALAFVALFMLGGGAAAWSALRPEPPPVADANYQFEFDILPLEMHEDPDYPELQPEEAPSKPRSSGRSSSVASRSTSPSNSARNAGAPESAGAVSSAPTIAEGPLEAFAVPVALGDRGPKAIELSDPEEISEMIGRVLARGQPQITRCYESRLNAKSGLSGTWLVDFTVEKDGHAADVLVQALDDADRELESCIARAVERWDFQRVKFPVPSGTKYRFAPRG